jgi:hypothetical protein
LICRIFCGKPVPTFPEIALSRAQPPHRAFGDRTKHLQERTDACVVLDKVERTMDWRIEPLILPLMVATLLLIAAVQAGHG